MTSAERTAPPLRSRAAVAGVGHTAFGVLPGEDAVTLGLTALRAALDDAGLRPADVDGLVLQRVPDFQRLVRLGGLAPRYLSTLPAEGRHTGATLLTAVAAVASGAAETVAVVYGNDGRSAGARYGGVREAYGNDAEQLWLPYGMSSPGAVAALMFQHHQALYGTTTDHLGEVAVAFRAHARLNPAAVMHKPMSLDDYRAARYICEPLRLLDYCLINDGGVALVITRAERARDLKRPPVYIRGIAVESRQREGEFAADFGRAAMAGLADRVYRMADVTREDIDTLGIYDNFTPTILFNLEGFGFCPPGQAGPWVAEGHLRLGGRWPTNTSGGHLSESYMQGWALQVELVRQLRGECGQRQVPDAGLAQYLFGGPIGATVIYAREP